MEHLCSRTPLFWGVDQEAAEQTDGLGRGVRDQVVQWEGRILLEGDLIVVRQLHHLLLTGGQRGGMVSGCACASWLRMCLGEHVCVFCGMCVCVWVCVCLGVCVCVWVCACVARGCIARACVHVR